MLGCSQSSTETIRLPSSNKLDVSDDANAKSAELTAAELRANTKDLEKLKHEVAKAKTEIHAVNSELEVSRQKQVSLLTRLASAEETWGETMGGYL